MFLCFRFVIRKSRSVTVPKNGICQYVRKYAVLNKNICHFFGTVTERDFRKKSKAQKHIQIGSMLRSGFFFRKTRSVMVLRFGFFFQDSRIRVNVSFEVSSGILQLVPPDKWFVAKSRTVPNGQWTPVAIEVVKYSGLRKISIIPEVIFF